MSVDKNVYKRIPEKPRLVKGESDFTRLAKRIAQWCVQPGPALRMGAVWGERGSGKTSMIETVKFVLTEEKRKNEEKYENIEVGSTLFEPAKLEVGEDNLLFAILNWLKDEGNALQNWRDGACEAYTEIQVFEAKLRHPDRFLEYETEVATDASCLAQKTADFYAEISMPTKSRREFLKELFHDDRRYVVFVDDVDLSPSLGPAILEHFHILFPNVSLTVLFAADRGTLLTAFDRYLERKKNAHIGLASKTLAKYLDVEWYLPTPTLKERRGVVEDGPGPGTDEKDEKDIAGKTWLKGSRVWDPFRPPLYRNQAIASEHVQYGRGRNDDDDDGRPFESHHAKQLADELLPRTWRGVNRVYNRMAELFESLGATDATDATDESVAKLFESLKDAVGSTPDNTPSFMRLLLSFDESYPELGLYQSFVEDPDELRDSLKMTTERDWKRGDGGNAIPVVERLEQLDPSRRPRAQRLLQRFAWLWQELWQRPETEPGTTFVRLSVRDDASEIAGDWALQFFDEECIVDLDLHSQAGATPTRDRIASEQAHDVCEELKKKLWGEHPPVPREGAIVVFPRAPLSVCAYLGYLLGFRDVAAVFGREQSKLHSLRLRKARPVGDRTSSFAERRDRDKPSGRVDEKGEARVVLAVGGLSGVSGETVWSEGDRATPVSRGGPRPFVYETDSSYWVGDEDSVANLIHDALEILSEIRVAGAQKIHLGLKMPAALAVLLGTRLSSVQPVRLYEWSAKTDRASYDWVCTIGEG